MRISKSGKLTVSLTCESASPGSRRFPRHANQQVREADGFPDMRISKSGKLTVSLTCESASPGSRCFQKNLDANPEKSGFCGKSSTPAHVRFFPKPFISFASPQLRLRWHSPCALTSDRPRYHPVGFFARIVKTFLRFDFSGLYQVEGPNRRLPIRIIRFDFEQKGE